MKVIMRLEAICEGIAEHSCLDILRHKTLQNLTFKFNFRHMKNYNKLKVKIKRHYRIFYFKYNKK